MKKDDFVLCKICNQMYEYKTGHFVTHLYYAHKISLKNYIIQTELNGVHPKCQCGFCDDKAKFFSRKIDFATINSEHKRFDWIIEQKIKRDGYPSCPMCNIEITKHDRGIFNKYCDKCRPNSWNQLQVKKTVREKYGVDNVGKLDSSKRKAKETISNRTVEEKNEIYRKVRVTKQERYENGAFDPVKLTNTLMSKYGVPCSLMASNMNHYSEVSQKLFWNVYNNLPTELQEKTYFAELNREYNIRYKDKVFCYDFVISNIGFVIEFNGDRWHGNPKLFEATDRPNPFNKNLTALEIWNSDDIKINAIKEIRGYDVEIVWEADYYKKSKEILIDILNMINKRSKT